MEDIEYPRQTALGCSSNRSPPLGARRRYGLCPAGCTNRVRQRQCGSIPALAPPGQQAGAAGDAPRLAASSRGTCTLPIPASHAEYLNRQCSYRDIL